MIGRNKERKKESGNRKTDSKGGDRGEYLNKKKEIERVCLCVFVCAVEITQRGANLNASTRQKKYEVRERKRCTHREKGKRDRVREKEIQRESGNKKTFMSRERD